MKKMLIGLVFILLLGFQVVGAETAEVVEEVDSFNLVEWLTQIEVLGSAGLVGLLSLVGFIRKQFKNGLLVSNLVAYAGKKIIAMLTSDDPETQEKANTVLTSIIALPQIQELFNKVASGAESNVAMLEAELANIKVKLEVGGWSTETSQQLIKAQEAIQNKLNEINS